MQLIFKAIAYSKVENHEDEHVEKIVISKKDIAKGTNGFRFVEENEFKLNDEMYDIIKKEDLGDKIAFYCINDKNEGILGIVFDKLLDENTNNSKKGSNTNSFQKNLITEALEPEIFLYQSATKEDKIPVFSPNKVSKVLLSIITPPPKV